MKIAHWFTRQWFLGLNTHDLIKNDINHNNNVEAYPDPTIWKYHVSCKMLFYGNIFVLMMSFLTSHMGTKEIDCVVNELVVWFFFFFFDKGMS